jgi:hypothetical protein
MIKGIDGMSDAEILAEVEKGGRFVYYMYCISILIMTFRRGTDVYFVPSNFVPSNRSAAMKGLPWTLLTLVCGWWGFPWGPIYSIQCLAKNLSGGEDVTARIVRPRSDA